LRCIGVNRAASGNGCDSDSVMTDGCVGSSAVLDLRRSPDSGRQFLFLGSYVMIVLCQAL